MQISAGIYSNDFATVNDKVTLQGVGRTVHMLATVPPLNGKAILTANTDVTIDHFKFSGAQVADQNGAGIRYQGGNLTITNSFFHDNLDGLLVNPDPAGIITIRNSEFAHNGADDGRSHNLYVNDLARLTIVDSYFHDAVVGHEIKSRARITEINGTRIAEGPDGTASYSVGLPNGGVATISNNIIEQGPNSQNPAIIHFGGEPYGFWDNSSLPISNNTIVNDLGSGSARLLPNQTGVTAQISDNMVYGLTDGQIAAGPASISGIVHAAVAPDVSIASPILSGGATAVITPPVDHGPVSPVVAPLQDAGSVPPVTRPAPPDAGLAVLVVTAPDDRGSVPPAVPMQEADPVLPVAAPSQPADPAPEPAPTPVADANHVRGTDATDFLNGTGSNDTIDGGAGDDFLQGADGADRLAGWPGDDRLADGPGDDMLMGGGGADRFVITAEDTGRDVVLDFRRTEGDRIDLHAIFGGGTLAEHVAAGQLAVIQLGGDVAVQVDVAGYHPVTVVDLQDAQLAGLGSDFILV